MTSFRELRAGDVARVLDAFMADARGRGITSRLVRALADRELGEGGLPRLELGYRVNNPGSGAVARAAGFIQEGLERGKFLVDGVRVDVVTAARLKTDPIDVA